ncbi:MAG: hypothetical protein OXJ52_02390 [Oligoflexia bacterium]|nr:hypothetical protein [Oligoflexia bacterium]
MKIQVLDGCPPLFPRRQAFVEMTKAMENSNRISISFKTLLFSLSINVLPYHFKKSIDSKPCKKI